MIVDGSSFPLTQNDGIDSQYQCLKTALKKIRTHLRVTRPERGLFKNKLIHSKKPSRVSQTQPLLCAGSSKIPRSFLARRVDDTREVRRTAKFFSVPKTQFQPQAILSLPHLRQPTSAFDEIGASDTKVLPLIIV